MPKSCRVTDCCRHAGLLAADNRKISFYKKVLARSNRNKRQRGWKLKATKKKQRHKYKLPVLSPALSEPNRHVVLIMATEPTLAASITQLDMVALSSVSACIESMSEAIKPSAESLPRSAVNLFGLLHVDNGKSPESVLTEPSVLPFENVAAIETVPLTPTLPSVETLQLLPALMCEESEPALTSIEIVLPALQDIETLMSFQPEPPTPVPYAPTTSIFEDVTALTVVSTCQTVSLTGASSQTSPVLLTTATEPLKRVPDFETLLTLPSALLVPIMSTLPFMQSHAAIPSGPVITAVETVMPTPADLPEVQGEHSYYKSDLTIEQLEGIITNLQKKVKVIQQRERRNSARLKAMENLVDQLKKENVLSEEKLKIMAKPCSQINAQVVNPSSTVTVVCEDNGTIIYAVQQSSNEGGDTL